MAPNNFVEYSSRPPLSNWTSTLGLGLEANSGFPRDQRKIQVRWQSSENNDDITTLQYHPSRDEQLLSGGDDGLVSLFDTSIPEEDDSMIEAFNFAPVHKTGYLSDMAIYALSADQKFSIYPVNSSQFDGSDVNQPVSFGDLRPIVKCNYVIDVLRDAHQPYIVTGSNLRSGD